MFKINFNLQEACCFPNDISNVGRIIHIHESENDEKQTVFNAYDVTKIIERVRKDSDTPFEILDQVDEYTSTYQPDASFDSIEEAKQFCCRNGYIHIDLFLLGGVNFLDEDDYFKVLYAFIIAKGGNLSKVDHESWEMSFRNGHRVYDDALSYC